MGILILSQSRWLELYQAWRESGLSKARFHRERMPDLCSDLVKYPSVYTLYDHFLEIERSETPRSESQEDAPKRPAPVKPAPIVGKPVKTTTVGSNLRVAELSLEAVEQIDLRYADRSRHEAPSRHPVRLMLPGGTTLDFTSADPDSLAVRMANIGRVRIV